MSWVTTYDVTKKEYGKKWVEDTEIENQPNEQPSIPNQSYIDEKLGQITSQQTALQAEILKIGGSI